MTESILPPDSDDWDPTTYRPVPFDRFRDELLKLYEPPMRARATHTAMKTALNAVAGLIGEGATTARLTPALIAEFVQAREAAGAGANTTCTTLALIRSACKYAKAQGYLRSTPFEWRGKWVRPEPKRPGKHHPIEDIRRVLELLASEVESSEGWARWRARRLFTAASIFAYTGMRRGEGLCLLASDVDLDGRFIQVLPHGGRTLKTEKSAQPVPIPEPLAIVLAGWLDHRLAGPGDGAGPDCPWLLPNLKRTGPWLNARDGHRPIDELKAAGERAGVQGLTFQSFRHSWATHAEAWGLAPAMIQRVLRHSVLTTQAHYRHADLANMREAVRGVDFGPIAGGEGSL